MAETNILVTGKHATDHITSAQMGAIQASFVGADSYITSGLTATMSNANTCHIDAGVACVNGRFFCVEGSTNDLSITSGQSGKNRNDLIVLSYKKDPSSALESGSIRVIAGTPTTGDAKDPSYTKGDILKGATTADVPLYRVEVRGIALPKVVKILPSIPSLSKLGENISQNFYEKVTGCEFSVKGNVATITVLGNLDSTDSWATKTLYTIPERFRPSFQLTAPTYTVNGGSWTGQLRIGANGTVQITNQGASGSTDIRGGTITWGV